ncbi:hypothetical protein ACJ41O_011979 [Fusarium nematophilum]
MACFSLMDVVKKIKGGTSTLERYHQQLQELRSLSASISENPLLQTSEVGLQTEAILSVINNNCLLSLRRRGRLIRTWGFLLREQDLLNDFAALERQKTSLSLAVEQVQCRALYQIQMDIRAMADRKSPPLSGDPLTVVTPYNQDVDSDRDSSDSWTTGPKTSDPSTIDPNIARLIAAFVPNFKIDSTDDADAPKINTSETENSGPQKGPRWTNMMAGPGFVQRNGNFYKMNAKFAQRYSQNPPSPSVFDGSIKLGRGDQINGHIVDLPDDADVPDFNGHEWKNGGALPFTSSGTTFQGQQINGMDVRGGKRKKAEKKG